MKYTIKEFNKQFKTDADCLAYIYSHRHPGGAICEKCGVKGHFYPVVKRRAYACECGYQLYPTAGTIFHKSPTSLKTWFFAMFLMTASKNGVSAKELERQLGVTYKCAWRIAHQIRQLLREEGLQLKGTVEADETYIGGKRPGIRGRGAKGKTPIFGVVERNGNVVAKATENTQRRTVIPQIKSTVRAGSTVMTDEFLVYRVLPSIGYKHRMVAHGAKEFVRGNVHTNSIEGFWSQLKRSIHGTFHHVSRKHLQKYVNEFSYRYNRRKTGIPMFLHLLDAVAGLHEPAV